MTLRVRVKARDVELFTNFHRVRSFDDILSDWPNPAAMDVAFVTGITLPRDIHRN